MSELSPDAIAFGMWSLRHNLWRDHHADWAALPEKERDRLRAHARWVLSMAERYDANRRMTPATQPTHGQPATERGNR